MSEEVDSQVDRNDARRVEPRWLRADLARLEGAGLRRQRRAIEKRAPGKITVEGREYVDFASNDYLGLATDPRVARAVSEYVAEHGFGSAASPLITGYNAAHQRLERELARFLQVESALLFGSGYLANSTTLAAIAGPNDALYCEKRNHASLIDGCRLSRAKLIVFRGDRLDRLEARLHRSTGFGRRWIVTDSVFSMDGDCAPLPELCDLAERFDAQMYVDEAHALGVLGPNGRGLAEAQGVEPRIALRLGTLGKALGSAGGFLAASDAWTQWLVNHVRGYIYSTAPPGVCAVAASAALNWLRREPERRCRVLELASIARQRLRELGIDSRKSRTPILPILVGDAAEAVRLASNLREDGLWAPAIRPPTVPVGTSRLRVSLGAGHLESEIGDLVDALGKSTRP